jgi:hypothetical protein
MTASMGWEVQSFLQTLPGERREKEEGSQGCTFVAATNNWGSMQGGLAGSGGVQGCGTHSST